jgi:hypothetical protein
METSTMLWLVAMAISGAGAFITGVIWAIRIEGKVLSHDREIAQLRDDLRTTVTRLDDNIKYIRDRIDHLIGGAR